MTFPGSSTAFPAPSDAGKPGASRAPRFGYTTALSGLRQGAGSHPVVIRTAPRIAGWMRPELWIGPKPMPGPIRGHTPGTEQWAHHLPARLLALQSACAKNFMSFQTTAIKKQPASGPAAMDTPPPSPWAEGRTAPLDPPGGGGLRHGLFHLGASLGPLRTPPGAARTHCRTDTPPREYSAARTHRGAMFDPAVPPIADAPDTLPHRWGRVPGKQLRIRGPAVPLGRPCRPSYAGGNRPIIFSDAVPAGLGNIFPAGKPERAPSFKTTIVQVHRRSGKPSFKYRTVKYPAFRAHGRLGTPLPGSGPVAASPPPGGEGHRHTYPSSGGLHPSPRRGRTDEPASVPILCRTPPPTRRR